MNDYYKEILAQMQDMSRDKLASTARRLHKRAMGRLATFKKHDYKSHSVRRLESAKAMIGQDVNRLPLSSMSDAELRSSIRAYSNFLSAKSSLYSNVKKELKEIMKLAKENELELTERYVLKLMERGENLHYAVNKISEVIGGSDWVKDFYEQSGKNWREAEARLASYYNHNDIKEIEESGLGGVEEALKIMNITF